MRCVVAERKVTIGSAALPVAPWMVTTAIPGAPTLYCVGAGVSDATMWRSDWMVPVLRVGIVKLADVEPACIFRTGSTG